MENKGKTLVIELLFCCVTGKKQEFHTLERKYYKIKFAGGVVLSRSSFIKVVLVIVLVMTGSMCFIASSDAIQPISIIINGKLINSDVAPEVKDNRVLVPIRVISEGIGAQVIWDGDNNRVVVTNNEVTPG
ncbi:MAG: copper amine oxidase N-terminal domain-containing protein, partial [Syntrophomonas sp.]